MIDRKLLLAAGRSVLRLEQIGGVYEINAILTENGILFFWNPMICTYQILTGVFNLYWIFELLGILLI